MGSVGFALVFALLLLLLSLLLGALSVIALRFFVLSSSHFLFVWFFTFFFFIEHTVWFGVCLACVCVRVVRTHKG